MESVAFEPCSHRCFVAHVETPEGSLLLERLPPNPWGNVRGPVLLGGHITPGSGFALANAYIGLYKKLV